MITYDKDGSYFVLSSDFLMYYPKEPTADIAIKLCSYIDVNNITSNDGDTSIVWIDIKNVEGKINQCCIRKEFLCNELKYNWDINSYLSLFELCGLQLYGLTEDKHKHLIKKYLQLNVKQVEFCSITENERKEAQRRYLANVNKNMDSAFESLPQFRPGTVVNGPPGKRFLPLD